MDGQPEYDKELSLSNTPLENLRTILSEADASAQTAPNASSTEPAGQSRPGISKEDIRRAIERLRTAPQQFLEPEAVRQLLASFMPEQAEARNVFENRYVVSLEKWIQNKS
jgi:hypothetical protein